MYKTNVSKLNLLASYAFLRDGSGLSNMMVEMADVCPVIIDSGAFSNYKIAIKTAAGKKQGKQTDVYGYMSYVKRLPASAEYISLDVIRDKVGTDKNLQIMVDAGLKPVPVYIEGYDEKDLDRILNINHRICVAGGAGGQNAYAEQRYRDVFAASGGRAEIHALGYARHPGVFQLPLKTCDSSSFNMGARYGTIIRYATDSGFTNVSWKEFFEGRLSKQDSARTYLYLRHALGIKDKDMRNPALYKGALAMASIPSMAGYYAYIKFMAHTERHGIGYYAAVPTDYFVLGLCVVLDSITDDGFDYYRARDLYKRYVNMQYEKIDYCVRVAGSIK